MKIDARKVARLLASALKLRLLVSDIEPERRYGVQLYIMHFVCGVSGPILAHINQCTRQAISKQVNRIELLREQEPDFDARIDRLETETLKGFKNDG